ncbi:MAG: signal peptide peptidase SppA [Coriobacteriia bacterium]|nr:signal peptide peptidase SppA [Coriobacteriia bacterium]
MDEPADPASLADAPADPAPRADAAARPSSGAKVALVLGGLALLALMGACGLCALAFFAGDGLGGRADAVALIHLDGVIAGTGGGTDTSTPEEIISALKDAEDDPRVKAILLRIDSPGGTVAASQEIATAVAAVEKPVVASIGDVGASGAYMVASQCDEIVASPTSSVGSIGVVMQVPNLEGLMEKVGVDVVVLTKGELKDVGSPFRELSDEERELIDEQMGIAYDQFIALVAEGRDLPVARVREMATGWVWMGVEAERMGLVDTLGNYTVAVERAAELGGIEGEPDVLDFDAPQLPALLRALLEAGGRLPDLKAAVPDLADPLGRSRAVPR